MLMLQPTSATAHPAGPTRASGGIDVDAVRQLLESAGYTVGAPVPYGDQTLVLEARSDSGRIVRAFVYPDAHAAGAAHHQAYAQQAGSVNGIGRDSDDAGPQLLSGFGTSTWRRNIGLVQSSPETVAELMPAEMDCTDLKLATGPDLSQALYRVDPIVVALFDALP